jgi:hypothetical protein
MFQSRQAELPWSRVICVHLRASVAEDSFTVLSVAGNADYRLAGFAVGSSSVRTGISRPSAAGNADAPWRDSRMRSSSTIADYRSCCRPGTTSRTRDWRIAAHEKAADPPAGPPPTITPGPAASRPTAPAHQPPTPLDAPVAAPGRQPVQRSAPPDRSHQVPARPRSPQSTDGSSRAMRSHQSAVLQSGRSAAPVPPAAVRRAPPNAAGPPALAVHPSAWQCPASSRCPQTPDTNWRRAPGSARIASSSHAISNHQPG